MKSPNILFVFLLLFSKTFYSQSIRKNHLEMTETEKINLVNALYQLRTGPDLINDLSNFHGNFFSFDNTLDPNGLSIHLNLPDRPENDIFFPWHRQMIFELEQAMQDMNPNITVPYWDSSTDQSATSSLWDENFLGQFNEDWNLGRSLGTFGDLPTPQDVINVQAETDFLTYSNDVERGPVHTGGHRWTGGVMRTPFSPRDPIFYFHHNYVDKLWAEWENIHESSSYIRNDMLRYNGSYNFGGTTFPIVNPNNILAPNTLGVFFAENGLALLENYSVNNTYRALEKFYYQYTIEAGNNFIVPSGTNCNFESVNEIILKPGFEVSSGGSFLAKIDNQVNRTSINKRGNEIYRNKIPFDDVGELQIVAFYNQDYDVFPINIYPNPFSERLNVRFGKNVLSGTIMIFDLMGKQIKNIPFKNSRYLNIESLAGLEHGVYIMQILDNETKKLIKTTKLIKIE
ncbi:MAG: tyrosinase family protein [Flavobacteriaceae bacterium]|nr:tyrosinase family protein [Flavobacteriaceae bacterium]